MIKFKLSLTPEKQVSASQREVHYTNNIDQLSQPRDKENLIPIRTKGLLKSNCKKFRHFPETDLLINLFSKVFETITLIWKFNKYYITIYQMVLSW